MNGWSWTERNLRSQEGRHRREYAQDVRRGGVQMEAVVN